MRGELFILHRVDSLLGGSEKILVLQLISFFGNLVALSI